MSNERGILGEPGSVGKRREGSGVGREEGDSLHGLGQAGPDIAALFPKGSGIAFDGEEDPGSPVGPEPSGDLLADLDHAKILFRLVVCERNRRIEEEGEDLPSVFFEAPEKVLGRSGLGASPGVPGFPGTPGFLPSPVEDFLQPGEQGHSLKLSRRPCPGGSTGLCLEKEFFHLRRPEMVVELLDGRQLPEEVRIAKRVRPWVGQIRSPEVVHRGSQGAIDDPQGFDPFLAPFFVKPQKGHASGRGDVTPAERRLRAETRFVGMKDRGGDQERANVLHEGIKSVGQKTAGLQDGSFAHDRAEEIGADLANPVYGKGLVLVQGDQGGLEPGSVLGRSGHPLGCRISPKLTPPVSRN